MSEKILVPVLGESITEASIARWIKSKGETVSADEPIVELETDKVTVEVPSTVTGTLSDIIAKEGSIDLDGKNFGSVFNFTFKNSDHLANSWSLYFCL